MPTRAEDYEVLHTIGTGSYGRCQKIRRKSDGKVSARPLPARPLVRAALSPAGGDRCLHWVSRGYFPDCFSFSSISFLFFPLL